MSYIDDYWWKRFSIEAFISSTENLNVSEIVYECARESQELRNITIPKKLPSYRDLRSKKQEYYDFLGGLSWMLISKEGAMAGTFSFSDKQYAMKVFKRLIEKGHLKPEALAIFNESTQKA